MLSRRGFLASAASVSAGLPAAPVRKPNVIVILADDLGYQDLGCTGSDYLKTPHIDSLAASGTRFSQWCSNAPVCAPARAALMTGRYPQRAGVATNGLALPATERTLATRLRSAGYATGLIGKWHLGSTAETVPNAHGFDTFYGFLSGCVDFYSHRFYWGEPTRVSYHDLWRDRTEVYEDGQYLTEAIGREAVRFVAAHRAEPFFLYLPFNAPHYPMHAPARYLERFAHLPLEQRVRAGMIAALDDAVGSVLGALRRHGLERDTIVFFSSDNGATREPRAGLDQQPPTTGLNAPFRGFKFSLFDGGMHVPALVRWPGRVPAGRVNSELAMHMDLLPTLCEAAGVKAGDDLDGRSLLPVWTGQARSPHSDVFWSSNNQLAVRRGYWKLVMNGSEFANGKRQALAGDDALFLSNLERDPGETRNLRSEQPALVEELRQAALRWQEAGRR